jgi:hypothetical protein
MTQETGTIQQEDVPSVDFEAKEEMVELSADDSSQSEEMDQADPRAAIYKKYDEKRAEEAGEPTPKEDKPAKQSQSQEEEDLVTVKVNGKERKVARAKIVEAGGVKAYQKSAAADEMLRQASEELRRAKEVESELNVRLMNVQKYEQDLAVRAQQGNRASSEPPDDGALKDMARKYHEAILDGDMDAADDLLVRIQRARTATPDENVLVNKAAAAARAALIAEQQEAKARLFERERVEVVSKFDEMYPDIAGDPELRNMADAKTLVIYNQNPELGPAAIIEKSVREVREWERSRYGAQPSDKLDAKRASTVIRSGSARAESRPAPKPMSPSQYVENLRRARGLDI